MGLAMYFLIGLGSGIGLVYNNSEYEAYYYPELVKIFYFSIDQTTIDLDTH